MLINKQDKLIQRMQFFCHRCKLRPDCNKPCASFQHYEKNQKDILGISALPVPVREDD